MDILLHACCGPCALMPAHLLREEGHNLGLVYANDNISPSEEYEKRLHELEKYAQDEGFDLRAAPYRPERWEREVKPCAQAVERGEATRKERCRLCYRLRLRQAGSIAKEEGYKVLSSTLAVSPYQFNDVLHEELDRVCEEFNIEPLFRDWQPYYSQATLLSREMGMYRQNYCGCEFSVAEAEQTRALLRAKRLKEKRERKRKRVLASSQEHKNSS